MTGTYDALRTIINGVTRDQLRAVPAKFPALDRILNELPQSIRQLLFARILKRIAIPSFLDQIPSAPHLVRHHNRKAEVHSLVDDQPPCLIEARWEHEYVGCGICERQLILIEKARQYGVFDPGLANPSLHFGAQRA